MSVAAPSRAFVLGDNIDTDLLAPGHHMKLPPAELAAHCLEAIRPDFAATVRPGDIVVAGDNFGLGSSREQAAVSLKLLGVSAVLARSFARIFYRNALNLGLLVMTFPEADQIAEGDSLLLDPVSGRLTDLTRDASYSLEPVPEHLMTMIADGGLVPHLKLRIAAASQRDAK